MVNNLPLRRLVAGQYVTKISAKGRVKIINGPIYELETVKEMLKVHGLKPVNLDADTDMMTRYDPQMEEDELRDVILTLQPNHYDDSEICRTTNGMEVHSDGYAIYWRRFNRTESSNGEKTYVKFGYRENNPKTLVLSIHPADH